MKSSRTILLSLSLILTFLALPHASAQSPKNGRPKPAHHDHEKANEPKQDKVVYTDSHDSAAPRREKAADVSFDRPPDGKPDSGQAIKLAVDLIVLDAQVMQQKTGRVVGDLKKEDFTLIEDGVRQQITHFSQDTLPLSVIILIDRGGCLDPFSEKVRHATLESLRRLRPQDEVALMAFHNTTELVTGFTSDRNRILEGLNRMPPHDEEAEHCFNTAFYEAAEYMRRAGNPDGRRVILMITGITAYFNCPGPSSEAARLAVLESGSVVCGIIPKTAGQRIENGIMRTATGIGGLFRAKTSNLKRLADETGGEVLSDKPENLDHTFKDLMDHLRTRYSIGFVSTNTRRDGSFRKLKLDVASEAHKSGGKLVVKTKRGYIAPRAGADGIKATGSN
ncbi:MAG TPA: VWA domain-containing protein [Blastocatellia bacterium]|jgi:VWFA-related protein|nr:VWA domain-containing protein [Blastocatellia bacterium]